MINLDNFKHKKYFYCNGDQYPDEEIFNQVTYQITKIDKQTKESEEYKNKIKEMKKKAWGILLSHNEEYPDLYLIDDKIYYGDDEKSSQPNIPFISKFGLRFIIERVIDENGNNIAKINMITIGYCSIQIQGLSNNGTIHCYDGLHFTTGGNENISYTFINYSNENEFLNNYSFKQQIKHRKHSFVYKVIHKKTNEMKVVKIIDKEWLEHPERMYDDLNNLMKLNHPNILNIEEYY